MTPRTRTPKRGGRTRRTARVEPEPNATPDAGDAVKLSGAAGEPERANTVEKMAPEHEGDLPGELGPPAGESSRVR